MRRKDGATTKSCGWLQQPGNTTPCVRTARWWRSDNWQSMRSDDGECVQKTKPLHTLYCANSNGRKVVKVAMLMKNRTQSVRPDVAWPNRHELLQSVVPFQVLGVMLLEWSLGDGLPGVNTIGCSAGGRLRSIFVVPGRSFSLFSRYVQTA